MFSRFNKEKILRAKLKEAENKYYTLKYCMEKKSFISVFDQYELIKYAGQIGFYSELLKLPFNLELFLKQNQITLNK